MCFHPLASSSFGGLHNFARPRLKETYAGEKKTGRVKVEVFGGFMEGKS
jgi:hypothetical protein